MLRIEDTDPERSTPQNVNAILDGIDWLGLEVDEGPYYQSDRIDRYRQILEEWLGDGRAYRCYCTREELDALRADQLARKQHVRYDGRCRDRSAPRDGVDPVVRFRHPWTGKTVVDDQVRGRVVFDNEQLDDLVIARSDGTPTYNFAVVIDDHDMGITHVIRGDDHLNNAPRQLNMYAALGAAPPSFAHLPMILGPDGAKLSKRHGAVDVREYREQGYLPEALLNYLVRLGWSSGDKEYFSVEEMIERFDIADVNQSASTFNPEKLLWLNQLHIKNATTEKIGAMLPVYLRQVGLDPANGPEPVAVASAFQERAETLLHMAASCRYLYEDFGEIEPGSARKHLRPAVLAPLKALRVALEDLDSWSEVRLEEAIKSVAERFDIKFGKIGQPVRVAITGGPVSPPIDATLALVGRSRTLSRLDSAIEYVEARESGQNRS